MKYVRLEHRFVHYIPEQLEPGVLYVSMDYATAAHTCCCGCGEEVVTPFSPTDWKITFDGKTISLWPSIGNWDFACRSHYVIKRSRVVGAGSWTNEKIAAERRRDKAAKTAFYGLTDPGESNHDASLPLSSSEQVPGLWSRIKRWMVRM